MSAIINLKIDHTKIDADLTDFPVMINLANFSDVWTEITSDSDRKKLSVKDSGDNQLYVEIEQFDTANSKGILWVKVPSVSSSADTELTLEVGLTSDNTTYVGDTGDTAAENVWDSNFKAVYHMNQDPSGGSGCILDSTSNSNDGTPGGSMTSGDLVDADYGKALDFDGSDDYISVPSSSDFDFGTGDFTLCISLKTTATTGTGSGRDDIIDRGDPRNSGFVVSHRNSKLSVCLGATRYDDLATINNGNFRNIIISRASSSVKVNLDNSVILSTTNSNNISYSASLFISRHGTKSESFFNGTISEIKFSNTARSDAWIKATYYSNTDNLLTQVASGPTGDISASLPALTCWMGPALYSFLPALSGTAYSGACAEAETGALTCTLEANKFSFSGPLTASIGALTMTGDTDQYRDVEATLQALACEMAGTTNRIVVDCEFPGLISEIHAAGYVSADVSALSMAGVGFNEIIAQISSGLPEFSTLSIAGAHMPVDLVCPMVEMIGRNQAITELAIKFQALRTSMAGSAGIGPYVSVNIPAPRARLSGHNSAPGTLSAGIPSLTFSTTAYTGIVATMAATMPSLGRCRITANPGGPATIECTLPVPELLSIINNSNSDAVLRHVRGKIR